MDRSVKKTAEKVSINLATSRNKKRELVKVDYSSWSARPTVMVQPSQYPTQRLYKTSTDLTCRTGPAKWISLIGPTFKGCSCRRNDPQKQTKRNKTAAFDGAWQARKEKKIKAVENRLQIQSWVVKASREVLCGQGNLLERTTRLTDGTDIKLSLVEKRGTKPSKQ